MRMAVQNEALERVASRYCALPHASPSYSYLSALKFENDECKVNGVPKLAARMPHLILPTGCHIPTTIVVATGRMPDRIIITMLTCCALHAQDTQRTWRTGRTIDGAAGAQGRVCYCPQVIESSSARTEERRKSSGVQQHGTSSQPILGEPDEGHSGDVRGEHAYSQRRCRRPYGFYVKCGRRGCCSRAIIQQSRGCRRWGGCRSGHTDLHNDRRDPDFTQALSTSPGSS
jgi:hypothetical protein